MELEVMIWIVAIVAIVVIIAMHLFDNFMTRSPRPAPTGLQVTRIGDSIVLTWDSANEDTVVGYEYDYASFGIPIFVVPTWKTGAWRPQAGTEETLYGPDDKR